MNTVLLWACLAAAAAAGEVPTPGKQVPQQATLQVAGDDGRTTEATVKYLLFLPEGYARDEHQQWPLLLFLHGSGERGDDLNLVKRHGPPKLLEAKPDFPFVVVSPQCPKEVRWNPGELANLVNHVANTLRIDRGRMVVTGLSMGGSGTWSLLAEYPSLFAAGAPICGRGEVAAAARIAKTPVHAFIGAKDKADLVKGNEELVAAIRQAGGDIQFTVYPDVEHDSWTQTYDNPQLYEWLLAQRSGAPRQ